jgi:hypothetical protein
MVDQIKIGVWERNGEELFTPEELDLNQFIQGFVAPPFVLGLKGNASAGTWFQSEGVPSNVVGIPIFVAGGVLDIVHVKNEDDAATFEVEVYEHDGTAFTLLATVSVSSARGNLASALGVSVTQGKEMAAKVSSGSAKNAKVAIGLKGN